ncbi:MAG: hypothetical protein RLZZ545_867, partial [Actinomycetota bacterium]
MNVDKSIIGLNQIHLVDNVTDYFVV